MKIMPSILMSDLARIADEIATIPSADAVHIDVMDNHFVPNLTMGLPVVEAVRAATAKPLDVHLMIEDADRWAPGYAEAGAKTVTFHVEAANAPVRLARELRQKGARASMALRPATSIEAFADLLGEFDQVLVMTVEPGFGGQPFLEPMLAKVARVRQLADQLGIALDIQVDGGISLDTIGGCAAAGANTFVAGVAVFQAADPDKMVQALRDAAQAGSTLSQPGQHEGSN